MSHGVRVSHDGARHAPGNTSKSTGKAAAVATATAAAAGCLWPTALKLRSVVFLFIHFHSYLSSPLFPFYFIIFFYLVIFHIWLSEIVLYPVAL